MPRITGRPTPNARLILAALADACPVPPGGAALFLLSGLPGTGKSTFATALSALTGATVLESDRCRRLLFPAPQFSARESGIVFRAIRSAALDLIRADAAVIIDATNVSESDRVPFYEIADRASAPLFILALTTPMAVVEGRLERRMREAGDCSLAGVAVYHRMRGRVEPISREHRRIDTSDPADIAAALTTVATAYLKAARPAHHVSGEGGS